jgi:DNA polymerase-3 subunit gamma/tau
LPAQALYLRWRPRTFEHVIGQEHITRSLRNAIIQDRVRHAYLFNGPRGTGKTTMARILAKAINCQHEDPAMRPCDVCAFCESINEGRFLDLIEIDAASHTSVDDVRDLREKIVFAPTEGRYKVYIVDEVHRFSGAAFDALLKTLEEPPNHAIFVLATTELDKVPATIKSRSLMFEFRRVSVGEVADRLQLIVDDEGIQAERDALELVARLGTGSVRDSISLLDQLISDPNEKITLQWAEQVLGTASNRAVGTLIEAILDNNVAAGLDTLSQAVDEGADPAQFGRQIVEYLRNLMLVQTGGPSLVDVSSEVRDILQQQAERISRGALLRAVRAFNSALGEMRGGWQPQLPLELALIESTRPIHENGIPAEAPAMPAAPSRAAKPAAASVPLAPQPAVPGDSVTLSASHVQQAWPAILKATRSFKQQLGALLDHTTFSALEGKTIVISAKEGWVKDKLEDAERRNALGQIMGQILKTQVQVKVITGGATARELPDTIADDDLLSYVTSDLGGPTTDIDD